MTWYGGQAAADGPGRIVHRNQATAAPGEPPPDADVLLLGPDSRLAATAPVVVRFGDRPAEELGGLAPAGTMLAEARSGLMRLQLGHRDGPFCLAAPIAGLGAGILGALSAASGLLSRARDVTAAWNGTVSDRDGALVMQTLSASFLATPSAAGTQPRYRDPYTVSFSPIMRFHRARDGWVFIAAVSRHMWHTLFALMGRSDLPEDGELDRALPFNIANQAQGERLAALVAEFVAGLAVSDCVNLMVGEQDRGRAGAERPGVPGPPAGRGQRAANRGARPVRRPAPGWPVRAVRGQRRAGVPAGPAGRRGRRAAGTACGSSTCPGRRRARSAAASWPT